MKQGPQVINVGTQNPIQATPDDSQRVRVTNRGAVCVSSSVISTIVHQLEAHCLRGALMPSYFVRETADE